LADTRGIDQDELHKKSIASEIQKHIGSVTAVLILANGSVPRITAGMDYALSTLSALFPKSLASNIAFIFTMSSLSSNVSEAAIPEVLKSAPRFLLNNPISLQKKFLDPTDDPSKQKRRKEMRKEIKSAEQRAMEMLVELFDWLDGLEPQSTKEILALYEQSQAIEVKITDTFAQMDQQAAKMAEINKLMEELQKKSAVSFSSSLNLLQNSYTRWT